MPEFEMVPQEIVEEQESTAELDPALKDLIEAKLWAAWGVARHIIAAKAKESYGRVVNVALTGEIFYQTLFAPESIGPEVLELASPKDRETLTTPLPDHAHEHLEVKDFIDQFRNTMVNEVDFKQAYFPGVNEAVEDMLHNGEVRIWTTGDMYGVPSLNLPGSYEQGKRVTSGGWHELMETYPNLDFVAHEDKIAELDRIMADFDAKGVNTVVVIDDKVDNLLSAKRKILAAQPEWQVITVWDRQYEAANQVRQGYVTPKLPKGFEGTPEGAVEEFGLAAITDLREAADYIPATEGTAVGYIVDHDDVISNDQIRHQLQQEAVVNWLQRENLV